MGPHAFEISRDDQCITLVGELDAMSSCKLEDALRRAGGSAMTIDLGRLGFIDSSGIRTLLAARRRHPRIQLVNPTKHHVDLFATLGITELLFGGPTG